MAEEAREIAITDLNFIGLKWAKYMVANNKNKIQARIKEENFNYTCDWSKLVFEFDEPEYAIQQTLYGCQRQRPNVIFKTEFINNTNSEQEFSFKTQRTTRSLAKITVEKGVSFGQEVNLKLKLPSEVLEANAGFKYEIAVKRINDDTTEEEVKWDVNNIVKVKAKKKTTAELIVEEVQQKGSFSVRSRLHGPVRVSVTNQNDNNAHVMFIDSTIDRIIANELYEGLKLHDRGFSVDGDIVSFETCGTCSFKYGIRQQVRIFNSAPQSQH